MTGTKRKPMKEVWDGPKKDVSNRISKLTGGFGPLLLPSYWVSAPDPRPRFTQPQPSWVSSYNNLTFCMVQKNNAYVDFAEAKK